MHYCEIESALEFLSMGSYVKWWQEASILDIQELPFEILSLVKNTQRALAETGEDVLFLSQEGSVQSIYRLRFIRTKTVLSLTTILPLCPVNSSRLLCRAEFPHWHNVSSSSRCSPASQRKGSFLPTLCVPALTLIPVWVIMTNVPIGSSVWQVGPQWMVLFGTIMEPSGAGSLLYEVCHVIGALSDGHWDFIVCPIASVPSLFLGLG